MIYALTDVAALFLENSRDRIRAYFILTYIIRSMIRLDLITLFFVQKLRGNLCQDFIYLNETGGFYGMEWIEKLNEAIAYMEEHLTDEIDYEQLGKIACCSSYHFQRMFAYMAGVPLSEYIRRRKMSLAAVDLQDKDAKIIDVAAKYGYQSPTAFNRAFQSVHGIAPSAVKTEGVSVKSFPPVSFKIFVKGAEEMNYRIETKDAFRIVGVSVPLQKNIEENFAVIPSKWGEVSADGTLQLSLIHI